MTGNGLSRGTRKRGRLRKPGKEKKRMGTAEGRIKLVRSKTTSSG